MKLNLATSELISLLVVVFLCLAVALTSGNMMTGGMTDVRGSTAADQELANELKSEAERQAGRQFAKFEVTAVATQLVAGTNYFMKVDVGGGAFIHLRIYKPLPHTNAPAELTRIQDGKSSDDALEYF